MSGEYVLEILWDTGDLTETKISEYEYNLLQEYGTLFILMRFYLEGHPDARPVSYQVWDKRRQMDITPEVPAEVSCS